MERVLAYSDVTARGNAIELEMFQTETLYIALSKQLLSQPERTLFGQNTITKK